MFSIKHCASEDGDVMDLFDPKTIEDLIRDPYAALAGCGFPMMHPLPTVKDRLRAMSSTQRSQFIEEERRASNRNERARLDKYIKFLKSKNVWAGMDIHFPNLQPDQIIRDVAHFWLTGDVALNWSNESPASPESYFSNPSLSLPRTSVPYSSPSNYQTRRSSANTAWSTISGDHELYHHEDFTPSLELLDRPRHMGPELRRRAIDAGINPDDLGYRGEVNQSYIENHVCPQAYNCSLHITNVHPEASDREIFALIREGGVSKYSKRPPIDGENRHHLTCAVTLSFKEPHAAKNFLARCQSASGIVLRGLRLKAVPNRDPIRPWPPSKMSQTRILQITGPAHKMTADGIESFFHTKIKFSLVDRQDWIEQNGRMSVVFEFTSIEGRSRAAFKCFMVEAGRTGDQRLYHIRYLPDYCDARMGAASNNGL